LTRRSVELLALAPGARVLDLGCGCGDALAWLRESAGLGALGLDLRFDRLAQARECCTNCVVQGDAACLPLADESLDAILCECALSLCVDKPRVLAEVYRVLKPGAGLALADVYLRTGDGKDGNGFLRSNDGGSPRTCLEGARPLPELERLMEGAGFRLEQCEEHSPRLTQLAGELIFAYGSLAAFWTEMAGSGGLLCAGADRAWKMGYCLIVARKGRDRCMKTEARWT
jgi:SAM-dependent methyltransferase